MSFLRLNNVSKYYGDLCVVSNMDVAVEKGEFISLLGPSGCGKTTTLQMIAGFVEVSKGSIVLDGRDITHTKPNTRGLGIVFQSYALFPHMTVEDNVAFGLKMRRVAPSEIKERTREMLELVKLDQHGHRYPRELSGGQRQRVALARALVIRPPVLLLDEPLSNLDAKLREDMQFELRSIQLQTGTTTIMVTHDQSEALSISDRVVVMEDGRATQIDHPYRIYEHPRTEFISNFVGKTNLLRGKVIDAGQSATVESGPLRFELDNKGWKAGDSVQVSIRPEKLMPVVTGGGRLHGRVASRFFLGNQWLYELDSDVGKLSMVTSNNGQRPLDDGAEIGLDWMPDSIRILPPSPSSTSVNEHVLS